MRVGLIVEVEELLFDTLMVRSEALHGALVADGIIASIADITRAHAGVPAALALTRLHAARDLDATGREIACRRADDTANARFERDEASFSIAARDTLTALAVDHPIAVVTRGTRRIAQHFLDRADLGATVNVVLSLSDLDPTEYHTQWRAAMSRVHASSALALVPAALADFARQPGVQTCAIRNATGGAAHTGIALAHVTPAFVLQQF